MADETFRTKGAIEPDSDFASTGDTIFRWKGAIEPQPAVVSTDLTKLLLLLGVG